MNQHSTFNGLPGRRDEREMKRLKPFYSVRHLITRLKPGANKIGNSLCANLGLNDSIPVGALMESGIKPDHGTSDHEDNGEQWGRGGYN